MSRKPRGTRRRSCAGCTPTWTSAVLLFAMLAAVDSICEVDNVSSCVDALVQPPVQRSALLEGRQVLIILTTNGEYARVTLNALHFIQKHHSATNVRLIFLNRQAVSFFTGSVFSGIHVPITDSSSNKATYNRAIWRFRLLLARELLIRGIDVIFTDSDAVWVQDPLPMLRTEVQSDMNVIAQRGSYPTSVSKRWGATLCFGFIYLQSMLSTQKLLDTMMASFSQYHFDDQSVLNNILYTWASSHGMSLLTAAEQSANGKFLTYKDSTLPARLSISVPLKPVDCLIKVSFLPHRFFLRKCTQARLVDAVVAHCHSNKTGVSKVTSLKDNNLWIS